MTYWITDRLPTEADADSDGDVIVCTTPTLNLEEWKLEKWKHVTSSWPWRRCKHWTPPTPAPKPTLAAAMADIATHYSVSAQTPEPISTGAERSGIRVRVDHLDLRELNAYHLAAVALEPEPEPEKAPEPEKVTRGFLAFTRIGYEDGFIDCAIGTDHQAFFRFCAVSCFSQPDWVPVRPLPQPGGE